MNGERVRSVSIKWHRRHEPGQTWRFWRDQGPGFIGYRAAWFYVVVERESSPFVDDAPDEDPFRDMEDCPHCFHALGTNQRTCCMCGAPHPSRAPVGGTTSGAPAVGRDGGK